MEWETLVTALAGIVVLTVVYFVYRSIRSKKSNFWLDKNVPYAESPSFCTGFIPMPNRKFPWEYDEEWCKKFGRIFGTYQIGEPCLYITEPEIVRRILVKDFHLFPHARIIKLNDPIEKCMLTMLTGDDWKRVRSVISPSFSTGKLKKMVALMDECAVTTVNSLTKSIEKDNEVDCKKIFGGFTMDIIASTAFGTILNSSEDPNNLFAQNAHKIFDVAFPWRMILVLMFPKIGRLFNVSAMNPKVIRFFTDLIYTVVQKRKESKEERGDFLQNLLEAQMRGESGGEPAHEEETAEAVDKHAPNEESQSFLKEYSKNKTLSTEEFVAACLLFFIGGFETTTSTMSMVVYYLALNPDCQAKVVEEVDQIWKNSPNVEYESLSKLTYLDAVISETLRLIPPAPRIEREAVEDYLIEEANFTVLKGMKVEVPIYAMHKDPEFFPDPEKFDPERFLPENKESIRPYTYIPFGMGPRNCLGTRFTQLGIKMCLLRFFRNLTVEPCAETKIPPEILRGSGIFQPRSVVLKVTKRI